MKLISWNVNGIRSVYNKGLVEWIARESPDILCLQETKAQFDQFPPELIALPDYHLFHSSADKKGYSGVASFIREKSLDTKKMEKKIFDIEGRVLVHEFEKFFLVNCYFPNGQRDHNRVPYKLTFCEDILAVINRLKEKKGVIITGDFNTAHHPIDLANPKTNTNTTGFLPVERAWMDKITQMGWIDIYRHLNPTKEGAYTWWSNMANCRARNIGWRIDYFFISPSLLSSVKSASILPEVMGSDHCPVVLELH